jgi:hypothetical protein
MPDFGLTKLVLRAAKEAKVTRPAAEGISPAIAGAATPPAAAVPGSPPASAIAGPAAAEIPNPAPAAPERLPAAPAAAEVPTPATAVVEAPAAAAAPIEVPVTPAAPRLPSPLMPEVNIDERARAVSRANLGEFDLDATHQTNFRTITTTDDVKAVIAEAADRNAPLIEESRRGIISNEQLRGLANDLSINEGIVRAVLERESGGVLRPEVILGARQVLNASADRVLQLGKKISTGMGTDMDRLDFRRQIQFHDEYQRQFMGARAETGRALNAFGIPVGIENEPMRLKALQQTVDMMHGSDTDALAAMISQIDTAEGISKFTREYSRSRVQGVVQELFINGILSGLKTFMINFDSSALFVGGNVLETAVAARIGKMLPGTDHIEIGEATALMFGMITGFRDAMRVTAKAFREGHSLDKAMKYAGHTNRAISSQNLFRDSVPHPSLARAIDLIGAAIRVPTERGMAPTDEFFKMMAYRGEMARHAFLDTLSKTRSEVLNTEDFAVSLKNFMENPPPDVIRKGEEQASYLTFQSPLGPTAANWARALQGTPYSFLVTPFISTPINVFKAGLMERSPLALLSEEFRRKIAQGGRERDLALARLSMGSLTVGMVAVMTASGGITGGGPQNPDARRLLESSGWQPYSKKFQKEDGTIAYQSYARAEPFAYVIGATADAVEIGMYLDYDDETKDEAQRLNEAMAAIIAGVANNTMSKTFMQGIADFSEALNEPGRYVSGKISSTALAILPYSSFRRQAGQAQDPVMREAWTLTDKLVASSGIPGWSENAPPRRDVFGEPMYHKGGSLMGIMSPFPDSTTKADLVMDEVLSVMRQTNTTPVGMPGRRIENLKLTVEEYDELVTYSRRDPLPNGLTFKENLQDLFENPAYQLATPDFKVALIKQLQNTADKVGRAMLEQNNEAFADRLADRRLIKQKVKFGAEAVIEAP